LLEKVQQGEATLSKETVVNAVRDGAIMRVRPVLMTATSDLAGLLPVLYSTGTGAEVMSRLAAPLVGGMISAIALTLLIVPCIYMLWKIQTVKAQ